MLKIPMSLPMFARVLLAFSLICPLQAGAVDYKKYPVLEKLVHTMVSEDDYPLHELQEVLSAANIDEKTLKLMDRQYESLPWYKYRKIFITQNRIDRGVRFFNDHKSTLEAANRKFGVSAVLIAALIGVETHYGNRMGGKRVLDSLVTLSAEYPRRSPFFTAELRTFLNTTRREKIDPTSVMGSFAGAIGIPQFMPSSYEAYAVDFNENSRRDLVNEFEDAIGSVANYLKSHGWKKDQSIYARVSGPLSEAAAELVSRKAKPTVKREDLFEAGILFNTEFSSEKVALLALEEENGNRHIVGFNNFYAITRYNPSVNYAMAVTELAEAIHRQNND